MTSDLYSDPTAKIVGMEYLKSYEFNFAGFSEGNGLFICEYCFHNRTGPVGQTNRTGNRPAIQPGSIELVDQESTRSNLIKPGEPPGLTRTELNPVLKFCLNYNNSQASIHLPLSLLSKRCLLSPTPSSFKDFP